MAKESFTLENLREELRGGIFRPLYLFYGEEDFLIDEAVGAVVEGAVKEGQKEFNLDVLHGGETDARSVLGIATSFPMMTERRVVIVRDVDRMSTKELELFTAYAENPVVTTSLVLTGEKVDLKRNPFVAIRRAGCAVECKRLYDNQVPAWVDARVRGAGRTIRPEATSMLAAYVGTSLRALQHELDKVFTYLGETTEVTADHISAVVGMSREHTVFELQKAVGQRDPRKALEVMEHLMYAGENVPFMIVMLTSYLTTLWRLQDLRQRKIPQRELASEARVNPYFLREYLEATGRFSRSELETGFVLLAEADERAKTGGGDLREILSSLLVRLLNDGEKQP